MSFDARLNRLELLFAEPPAPERCLTCGEPRAWALQWKLGKCPRCLDCGGVLLFAGSPARHPPPALSPLISMQPRDRCGERSVTLRYFGRAAQLCGTCQEAA